MVLASSLPVYPVFEFAFFFPSQAACRPPAVPLMRSSGRQWKCSENIPAAKVLKLIRKIYHNQSPLEYSAQETKKQCFRFPARRTDAALRSAGRWCVPCSMTTCASLSDEMRAWPGTSAT